MLLERIYLKTFAKFNKKKFSVNEFALLHKLSTSSSKVLVHRMNKNNQLLKIKHGEYVSMSPESFLKLKQLSKKNNMLYRLTVELFRNFPGLIALILYGSQVRGGADKHSDYDVLLILPEKTEKAKIVKNEIEKKLKIKLHFTAYSKNGYQNAILVEPYIRFWLAEGIVFDEVGITKIPVPPIAKMAYEDWQSTAETYIETADETKKDRYYFTALEIIELIKAALRMNYDFGFVKKQLMEMVGAGLMKKMRQGKKLTKKELLILKKSCKEELADTKILINRLGENEADIYWKEQISGWRQ